MKTLNYLLAGIIMISALSIQSCKKDKTPEEEDDNVYSESIMPTTFNVDVPDPISSATNPSKSKGDTLSGKDIYGHIRTFIYVGDAAGKIVADIINAINKNNINKAMVMPYTSDEDYRSKELTVVEQATFEGVTWEFGATVVDKASAGEADGGKALQVFWNRSPRKGIAIMKPYNIDRVHNTNQTTAMYRVDYSEGKENGYDKEMTVYITGLTLANAIADPYSMRTLKMFAGQKGTVVDVYGNSNHPNARFFNTEVGFNYAFVASADAATQLGVAEVGLPASNADVSDRANILDSASVKNLFTKQIRSIYGNVNQSVIDAYLYNCDAPGYFNKDGFVKAGTAPTANASSYASISPRIETLAPYNPKYISQLSLGFAK